MLEDLEREREGWEKRIEKKEKEVKGLEGMLRLRKEMEEKDGVAPEQSVKSGAEGSTSVNGQGPVA